jgi:hypothetical protein
MTDDQLNDLKQFIDSRLSETEQSIRIDMATKEDVGALRQEMQDGFAGVSEAIEQIHQQAETQEAEVDRRFTNLEQQTA